ncbi:MAG: acyltransferase family protein [Nannocystaceae bacterium]
MDAPAPAERLHAMDHLRALAMLAGVLFHAALAYSPVMRGFFPTADRQTSGWVDAVVWGLHLVRMPLFFFLAGFFAAWVIERRGGTALARQRVRRILVPFVVAWPLVEGSLAASTRWAALNVEHPSALLVAAREWMQRPDRPPLPPTTAHLWFLYYLLLLGVLHWAVRALEWGRGGPWLTSRSPQWLLLGLPLLLTPALASVSAPHPAPEGLLPQFWAIGFYGAFYALGALVHARRDWLERARPLAPWLTAGSATLYAVFLTGLAAAPPSAGNTTASWGLAAVEACLSVWLTVLCLLVGLRLLNRPSPGLRYLSQAAYWTYLVHLPLLFALQYALMDRGWPWPLKLALAVGATLVGSLLTYQLLVRHTPLRRFVG